MPGVPSAFDRPGLETAGFVGWRTWVELRACTVAEVPRAPGGYVVFRPRASAPSFLKVNPGGHFEGRDPSVSTERLHTEWVSGTPVVYIGKADILRTRLTSFAQFGSGKPVGHWGGRLTWQLADSAELLVAWRLLAEDGTARELEQRLLKRFAELHDGQRPFANLAG